MDNKYETEGKNDFNMLNYMLSKLTKHDNIKNLDKVFDISNYDTNLYKIIKCYNYYKPIIYNYFLKIGYCSIKIGYCSIKVMCRKNHVWH
jgi:hypothetical protein